MLLPISDTYLLKVSAHVSSIVKSGYQDNFEPVYFFYENVLSVKKHQTQNKRLLPSKKFLRAQKIVAFVVSVCLILFRWLIFACDVFLSARNLFVKKKINRLEIVTRTSFYHTTDVHLSLSTRLSRIYLYAIIFICNHL